MFPKLYEKDATGILDNGIGVLSDCYECVIREELNGEYTLTMSYPLDGIHADEIERGRLVAAKRYPSGNSQQLFRIKELRVDYIERKIEIFAPHISYDLDNYPVPPMEKKGTVYDWLVWLRDTFDYYDVPFPFAYDINITTSDTTSSDRMERIPRTVRSLLLTDNDALIDTYSPTIEFEFDNFNIRAWTQRGDDADTTGVEIRRGKNLTAFSTEETGENAYFGLIPYFKYDLNDSPVYIIGNKVAAGYNETDPTARAYTMVDFTEDVLSDTGIELNGAPTAQQLAQIRTSMRTLSSVRGRIKIIAARTIGQRPVINTLWIDAKKDPFSGVTPTKVWADVGDYARIYLNDEGDTLDEKVVAVEFDVLSEWYNTIEVGKTRARLSQTIKQLSGG